MAVTLKKLFEGKKLNSWGAVLFSLVVILPSLAMAQDEKTSSKPSVAASNPEARAKLSLPVQVFPFSDKRLNYLSKEEAETSFQPQGSVEKLVTNTISSVLRSRGFTLADDAAKHIRGEIREWQINGTNAGEGNKQATSRARLYVEVTDKEGKVSYANTYSGHKTPHTIDIYSPIAKHSLGVAMEQAVTAMAADEKLLSALSKK